MGEYDKFVIREPKVVCVDYHPLENVKGVTFPDEIWLDNTIVEGSPAVVDIGWRFEVPDPDPVEWTHSHDFDEVLCFIGTDPDNPRDLGGEIEFQLGKDIHVFDTTTVIFIPKGLPHCPFVHKRVDKPFLLVVFALSGHYPESKSQLTTSARTKC